MDKVCVFQHPHLKIRKEKFGGVVRSDKGIFLVGHEELSLLKGVPNFLSKQAMEERITPELLEKFLENGIMLEIDQESANIILEKGGDCCES